MARIRTVKPEFWEDEKVGQLSPFARLLFLGTWNLADDEGLLRWTADYLNASLFMYDDLTVRRVETLMAEVTDAGLIFPYATATKQKLAYVVNFRRHQKINRPQQGKFPPPSIQNPTVQAMYGARDGWLCHLCKGPINRDKCFSGADLYGGNVLANGVPTPNASVDLNLSLDHLTPRIAGGNDYPSNIAASHVGCNKARGAKPVEQFVMPESVRYALSRSVSDSVNDSVSDSPPHVRADQGSGTKEQGTGNRDSAKAGAALEPVNPRHATAQTILGAFISRIPRRPPEAVIGPLSKSIKQLLDEGFEPPVIDTALDRWQLKGMHPSTLPSFVNEVVNSPGPNSSRFAGLMADAQAHRSPA